MRRSWVRLLCASVAVAASGCAGAPSARPPSSGLVWLENDYGRALAEARRRHVPVFVDVWATWCPSCLFMREYLLTDARLEKFASGFVWVTLDDEAASSAPFLAQFAVNDLPALFVVDPENGQALAEWIGSPTEAQLEGLLQQGSRGLLARSQLGALDQQLVAADAADASGAHVAAAKQYRLILAQAPASWDGTPRATVGLLNALRTSGELGACAAEAPARAAGFSDGTWRSVAVLDGIECFEMASEDAPWREGAIALLLPLAERDLELPENPADVRCKLYEGIVALHAASKDPGAARSWAARWLAYVEDRAAHAPTPTAKASFNWAWMTSAKASGDLARALPALLESERALPTDWDPPARAAEVYEDLGRLPEALAANGRALQNVQGVNALILLEREARLDEALGHPQAAIAALERARAVGDALPESQRAPRLQARLKERLRKLREARE